MNSTINLLGLSGSLRKHSSHTAILRTVAERLAGPVRLTLHGLGNIPPYNEDLEGADAPPSVVALRTAVAQADGVLIGSPEYNHGMSGVLKNALDWLSRPHGRSVLSGRPVLTFTASPAFTGGVRAHQQLNETLWAIQAAMVSYPQIVIGNVATKIEHGRLEDEAASGFLMAGVDALIERATLHRDR
ncbi:NADPH:quinone oxidoreductase [Pseudomonas brassicacearum]|uniref:NADPH:quinone oxidoreductase n=2 Tax=Pseudomonas TaxID=286 RepID=A0A0G3GFD5_9PSED|nr:NAD(P)H-dependent oxidoreductase [Pseudomonas brassicacearum]AKJ99960.1 NADPH:quinone oxidoreductase [Pseudomonas chlororaphis]ROM87692.1 NADPH:quinone oxidoreductase [Pseudomonas brassicacearum]